MARVFGKVFHPLDGDLSAFSVEELFVMDKSGVVDHTGKSNVSLM